MIDLPWNKVVLVVNRGADIVIRLPMKYDFIDNVIYKWNKNFPSISDIICPVSNAVWNICKNAMALSWLINRGILSVMDCC